MGLMRDGAGRFITGGVYVQGSLSRAVAPSSLWHPECRVLVGLRTEAHLLG